MLRHRHTAVRFAHNRAIKRMTASAAGFHDPTSRDSHWIVFVRVFCVCWSECLCVVFPPVCAGATRSDRVHSYLGC